MEATYTVSLSASDDDNIVDSCSYSGADDIADERERRLITESPPPPPPPPPQSHSRRLIVTHALHGQANGEVQSGAAFQESNEYDDDSLDSRSPRRDHRDYDSHRFCDSEESEPPRYHSLNTVPRGRHMHRYLPRDQDEFDLGDSKHARAARAASPTHHLPSRPMMPPARFWRKQQQMSFSSNIGNTNNSYRSIQDTQDTQESVDSPGREESSMRREAAQRISNRVSETYLYTLRYCGLPLVIKPRKAALYTGLVLLIVNVLALILSWAALFSVEPSPSVITYSLTIVLGLSCVPCLFVFWAYNFNPFAAISAFSSTAFSGTFVSGLLQAFFVANNHEAFEDTKMAAIGSAVAAFDIIAAVLWLLVIIIVLIFYTADSEQRGHYTIQFIAFNTLAILILVTFLLTVLTDIAFFDKAGQINTMYLAVGFSLLSVLFSFCFCFSTGIAVRERESEERDEWSRFIIVLPYLLSAVLTLWTFICGILSMVIGTSLSHDEDYQEKYGASVAALTYLVGTLNFGVSIATISVGCILGVQMFM